VRGGVAVATLLALQLIAHAAALATASGGGGILAPLALPGAIGVWLGFRKGAARGLAALAALAVLAGLALGTSAAAQLLPLACQLAVCLGIAWLFGRTLLPGAIPLVTQMARAVHGSLPARIESYTRHVTAAWTLFMVTLAASSVLLFVMAPVQVWSLFANVLLLPLVALMFVAEYAYRSLRHGWFSHATLTESIAAFQRLRAERR
jgi:uncharacterized membrane protein